MGDLTAWFEASGLIGAFLFGVLSAFFPPLNAEIYAIAAPVISPDNWAIHVVAMTIGLVAGKVTHFVAAAKGADLFTRRRRAKRPATGADSAGADSADAAKPPSRLRATLTRWSTAMIDVLDRPRLGPLVMLASAGIGFPPLAVVTVAAGVKRVNFLTFLVITTIGCLARFLATSWLITKGFNLH